MFEGDTAMVSPMFPVPPHAEAKGATDVKWFAGLAMQAIIMQQGVPESETAREEIALWAFRMGQAMVAADHNLHASDAG
ncbi:MAG: hypothetical protein R3C10_11200 [Pirellulales bacterium]|nr:hypothetical protein [Planctomycetales bacterium]